MGELPTALREAAEMYAGCVSGAIQKQDYLDLIKSNGFTNIVLQKEKSIVVPDDILKNYLTDAEIAEFKASNLGIFSITVYAEKGIEEKAACCAPGCCS